MEQEIFFKGLGMDQDSEQRLINGYYKLLNGINGNDGQIDNVPQNKLIPNAYLPATGANKCVGYLEDLTNNSGVFFNYNSLGYHGIYRYFINQEGYTLGEIQKIVEVKHPDDYTFDNENFLNFDDDPYNLITGIAIVDEKLYWNQPNDRPKMIDMARANITRKRLKFNVYFNRVNFAVSTTYTLKLYEAGNATALNTLTWTTAATSYSDRVAAFMTFYSASQTAITQYHINVHSDYVEIEMSKVGDFYFDLSEDAGAGVVRVSLVAPENFYADKDIVLPYSYSLFKRDLIDRVRYPSLFEPVATLAIDTLRKANLVAGKVFQFRTRYNYYDYSESILGAISTIPALMQTGDNFGSSLQNVIEVDFTDPRLSDASLVSIIRSVDILVREHTTGIWRIADTLKPYQFAGPGQQVFKFYNDGSYQAIDLAKSVKPYDSVPLKAKSLVVVDDRLFDGGIVEGYDKPNLNATIDIEYTPQVAPNSYTIKGVAFIYNLFDLVNSPLVPDDPGPIDAKKYFQYNQCIYSLTNSANNIAFGGISKFIENALNPNQDGDFYVHDIINPNAIGPDKFPQRIPTGGFTFYLAGTEYKATSKQVEATYASGTRFINDFPFLNASTLNERNELRDKLSPAPSADLPYFPCYNPFENGIGYTDQNGKLVGRDPGNQYATKLYNVWEINNVPAGTYVIRIASHLINDALLNNGTKDYQSTSSQVLEVCGFEGFEATIVVGPSTADSNNVVVVGASVIADLAKPELADTKSIVECGYITDHDISGITSTSTYDEMIADTRIDNALMSVTQSGAPVAASYYIPFLNNYQYNINHWFATGSWGMRFSRCDHNGFYFYGTTNNFGISAIDAKTSMLPLSLTINKDYYNNPWAVTAIGSEGGVVTVWRNTNDVISDENRTILEGTVITSLGIQSGVVVVNKYGGYGVTGLQGTFRIITYDRLPFPSTPAGTRDAAVVVSIQGSGYPTFSIVTAINNYNILIGTSGGLAADYNYANPYSFSSFLIVLLSDYQYISSFKRGWDGIFGIVYYDEADRKCAVVTNSDLNKHILFYTEKDPATGLQVNRFYPKLSWSITSRPPDWAVKWQWVRTSNLQVQTYLQWLANSVVYINNNDDGTEYALPYSTGATQCKINLDNIGYYGINKHPNAVTLFTYQAGDRLRPISDAKGNLYPDYTDFEIIKVIGTDIYLYKDDSIVFEKGMLFEIYTRKDAVENNVFYEFGECYEVKTAVIKGVRQKYHAGQTQDQTYGYSPQEVVTPATGTFTSGDAYYRTREMQIGCVLATDLHPLQASLEGNVLRVIDDPSISDFFISKDSGVGRANGETGIVRSVRDSTVRFTNRYLSGSQTNGLSSNEPLNEKQFSSDFGLIMKMIVVNSDLVKAIFSNSIQVSMYVNKGILREASGGTLIAISEDVIPRTNEYQRSFGTINPESVSMNNQGDVFGWDASFGVYWRSSGNGLIAISDYFMHDFFESKATEGAKLGYSTINPSVYDLFHGKLIHTFGDATPVEDIKPKAVVKINDYAVLSNTVMRATAYPSNTVLGSTVLQPGSGSVLAILNTIINNNATGFTSSINSSGELEVLAPSAIDLYSLGTLVITFGASYAFTFQFSKGHKVISEAFVEKETIAFSIGEQQTPQNRWPEFYSFIPEYYGRVRQSVVSFKNGELWLHNQGPLYNNFYGVQYSLEITVVGNKDFQKNKVYKEVSYNSSSDEWDVSEITTPITTDYPQGQESKLSKYNFKATQGGVYSSIKNDMRDPRFADPLNALINGRPMRGRSIRMKFVNPSNKKVSLFSIKFIYFYSELS